MTKMWTLDDPTIDVELTASPTNRLMLAVLEEALVTFHKGLSSCGAQQRQHACEVDRWVESQDSSPLFSFENICTALKIDPEYLRRRLKRLKAAALDGQEISKPRGLRRERMYHRRAWRGHLH